MEIVFQTFFFMYPYGLISNQMSRLATCATYNNISCGVFRFKIDERETLAFWFWDKFWWFLRTSIFKIARLFCCDSVNSFFKFHESHQSSIFGIKLTSCFWYLNLQQEIGFYQNAWGHSAKKIGCGRRPCLRDKW